jgi:hypothetical protein
MQNAEHIFLLYIEIFEPYADEDAEGVVLRQMGYSAGNFDAEQLALCQPARWTTLDFGDKILQIHM